VGSREAPSAGGTTPLFTRRRLLAGAAGLGLAASLGTAAAGNPFTGGDRTISYWHLFGGGDGVRMTTMLDEFAAEHPDVGVRWLILPWGSPYYTKLGLAAVGGQPPDVAIVHATKLEEFIPSGLLEELTPELLARHGLSEDRFLPKPWQSCGRDGRQYAIPLDTHPFVLYYNTELTKKAGLLEDGELPDLDGPDALLDAFARVQERTGTGVVFETRGVTPWRLFLTLYTQLGGPPIIADGGTRLTIDEAKAVRALEWMAEPKRRGAGGADVDYQASVALFGNQTAAFALNGEWEVTTFQAQKLPFDMRPVPTVFDSAATQADSHTFVIPRNANRPPERLDAALRFVSALVGKSLFWAGGGHVPAYRPVFESDEYRKLEPQSHYASVVDNLVFDPLAWYSGSGSQLEAVAGTSFKPAIVGTASPRASLDTFMTELEKLVEIPRPV
jgi:multiple sugar transport system substrate-binding protein